MAGKEKGKVKGKVKGKEVKVKATETPKQSSGRVRPCGCTHEFQDKEYGKGMRLHTEAKGTTAGSVRYRCTVCLLVKG